MEGGTPEICEAVLFVNGGTVSFGVVGMVAHRIDATVHCWPIEPRTPLLPNRVRLRASADESAWLNAIARLFQSIRIPSMKRESLAAAFAAGLSHMTEHFEQEVVFPAGAFQFSGDGALAAFGARDVEGAAA